MFSINSEINIVSLKESAIFGFFSPSQNYPNYSQLLECLYESAGVYGQGTLV